MAMHVVYKGILGTIMSSTRRYRWIVVLYKVLRWIDVVTGDRHVQASLDTSSEYSLCLLRVARNAKVANNFCAANGTKIPLLVPLEFSSKWKVDFCRQMFASLKLSMSYFLASIGFDVIIVNGSFRRGA